VQWGTAPDQEVNWKQVRRRYEPSEKEGDLRAPPEAGTLCGGQTFTKPLPVFLWTQTFRLNPDLLLTYPHACPVKVS
jgi:hypothetical protein